MRSLLERIVEKTRNPEAGADAALMPLVAPLYAAAPQISQLYAPVEQRHGSPVHAADSQEDATPVSAERPAAEKAAVPADRPQQAIPRQKDESIVRRVVPQPPEAGEIPSPRASRRNIPEQPPCPEPGIARSAEPFTKTLVSEPAEPHELRETPLPEVPAPSIIVKQVPATPLRATPRSETPVRAERFPEAKPAPMRAPEGKAVPTRRQEAAFPRENASHISTNYSDADGPPPPQITVSIGHIEVRAALQQPAERPRRPEFRPSLSLSEFLNGSDGGRR
jgi:hypothetical protein